MVGKACYPGAVAQQSRGAGTGRMVDERDARIAQLELELRQRDTRAEAAQRQIDALRHEVERLRPALTEALEQQTATADVLRIVAAAPISQDTVLQAIS